MGLSASGAIRAALSPRSNAAEVASYISREARSEDLVVLLPADLVLSFEREYVGRAPLFSFPEGTEPRPFHYNDRLVRETDSGVLDRASRTLLETLQSGGRIWVVSVGIGPHLEQQWGEMPRHWLTLGFTAVDVPDQARWTATHEAMKIRVWYGRPGQ